MASRVYAQRAPVSGYDQRRSKKYTKINAFHQHFLSMSRSLPNHRDHSFVPGTLFILTGLLLWLIPVQNVHAMNIDGIEIPLTLRVEEHTLGLNGAGLRRKVFVDAYIACLYLTEPDSDPERILQADEPQAVVMHITSDLVTRIRLAESLPKDLARSTGDDMESIRPQTDQLLSMFDQDVGRGDVFKMVYLPGDGTRVWHNGEFKGRIEGLDFKRALFGIWLSENPTQKSLKKKLLAVDLEAAE